VAGRGDMSSGREISDCLGLNDYLGLGEINKQFRDFVGDYLDRGYYRLFTNSDTFNV
jgi:hypothetical protein